MRENKTQEQHEHKEKSFEDLLEESLNIREDEEKGNITKGTVVRVDKDIVFVDFGYKSEGIIPIEEFGGRDDKEIEVGAEVDIFVERFGFGGFKVSKRKADLIKEQEFLSKSFQEKTAITVVPATKVKGGYLCNVNNKESQLRVFLPFSQVSLYPDMGENIMGKPIQVRIIQNDNNSLVISRRVLVEEEREIKRQQTLSCLKEGENTSGEVVKIIDSGAFVDVSGVTGFIPIGEMSWCRIKHPSEAISEKQTLELKVVKIENDGNRVTLSLKQMSADPWESIKEKYPRGSKVKGKIVSIKEFGVFVEVEPGIEGLIHVTELAWIKNFRHPREMVQQGSIVEVVIIAVNKEEKKLSLSLKQVEPTPWEMFRSSHKIGSVINGTIKNINEHGIFVEVEEGMVGLVRPENIVWKGRVNPLNIYGSDKIGEKIDVSLLHIDIPNQKIALGIKQLSDNPWELVKRKYKIGETVLVGKVKEIKPNGITVELENELEGFYKNSEFETIDNDSKKYKIGEEVTGLVTGFDKNRHQINLSIKKLEKKREKEQMEHFVASSQESNTRFGDILAEELKSLDN